MDAHGPPRILLSAKDGTPRIVLSSTTGAPAVTLSVSPENLPSVVLENPNADNPTAAIEVDDKGAHVKFDRKGGASSYLLLNNAGTSGVVLIDAAGLRRVEVLVNPDGSSQIVRYDDQGHPLPASAESH